MAIERSVNTKNNLTIKKFDIYEKQRFFVGGIKASEAGNFLKSSGISDVVIDFRQGFLGDMGNLANEIPVNEFGAATGASIVLEWIDPDDLRHLVLSVTAGFSESNEKYICASFREKRRYRGKKYDDPPALELSLLYLGKEFDFKKPISRNEKTNYKKWLREKVLNYRLVWGE